MKEDENPITILAGLEACRQKLSKDIEEAEKLLGAESPELRTVRIGLAFIQEMIEELRAKSAVDKGRE
jgi:hypothetical protein